MTIWARGSWVKFNIKVPYPYFLEPGFAGTAVLLLIGMHWMVVGIFNDRPSKVGVLGGWDGLPLSPRAEGKSVDLVVTLEDTAAWKLLGSEPTRS